MRGDIGQALLFVALSLQTCPLIPRGSSWSPEVRRARSKTRTDAPLAHGALPRSPVGPPCSEKPTATSGYATLLHGGFFTQSRSAG